MSLDNSASNFAEDFGVIREAVITGRKIGANDDFWAKLAHNRPLFKVVVASIKKELYTLSINFNLYLQNAIGCVNYKKVDEKISRKNFPKIKTSRTLIKQKVIVYWFKNREISFKNVEVYKEIKRDGFYPATIDHLVAFNFYQPDLSKEGRIYALGSYYEPQGASMFHYVPVSKPSGNRIELGVEDVGRVLKGRKFGLLAVLKEDLLQI